MSFNLDSNVLAYKVFRLAKKKIPESVLKKIFGERAQSIEDWASDPRYCGPLPKNPIQEMIEFLIELDKRDAGCAQQIITTIQKKVSLDKFKMIISECATICCECGDIISGDPHLGGETRYDHCPRCHDVIVEFLKESDENEQNKSIDC